MKLLLHPTAREHFPRCNYFIHYLDWKTPLETQLQQIEEKAQELQVTDTFQIEFQKHILIVAAALDGMSQISSDDMTPYLDEPAALLNQSIQKLAKLLELKEENKT